MVIADGEDKVTVKAHCSFSLACSLSFLILQSVVKLMRGLLQCMIRQVWINNILIPVQANQSVKIHYKSYQIRSILCR